LKDLLSGEKRALDGSTEMSAVQYTDEIVRSGFPAIRELPDRARRA